MAVSQSWFHQWQPTSVVTNIDHNFGHGRTEHYIPEYSSPEPDQLFEDPFYKFVNGSNKYKHGTVIRTSHKTNHQGSRKAVDFLPVFLSMSLLQPTEHKKIHNGYLSPQKGPLNPVYEWNQLDYAYESEVQRNIAISSEQYIVENNLPLGLDAYGDRIFVTIPRWRKGVPATLTWLPKNPIETSPLLNPYPNWDFHTSSGCQNNLVSVFRVYADTCGRLWVLDSGQVEVLSQPKAICPPAILVFDLKTDELLFRYEMPAEFIKQDSLYTNIVVDIRHGKCSNAFAYVTDVWRYGIMVFSLKTRSSWRLTHSLFYPDPILTKYQLGDLTFRWNDGIFGMALSPLFTTNGKEDRLFYYHPMSSSREFYIKVSSLLNETYFNENDDTVKTFGQSRGPKGHSSASGMDRKGVLFYNMVTQNSVGCWDSSKPYLRHNLGVVQQDNETLVFPNDLKLDHEAKQSVWVLSNRLPFYLYRGLDKNDINFRIFRGYTDDVVKGTVCDPQVPEQPAPFDDPFDNFDTCFDSV